MENHLDESLRKTLLSFLGEKCLSTDQNDRAYYSQDVYSEAEYTSHAVISPTSLGKLSKAVKCVVEAGYSLFPRGGGLSYTGGYLPTTKKSISLDMSYMDAVKEINQQDMYVTVQAGCTWDKLHKALKGTGLRTPFWGTLSGLYASIGGSISQNSIFFGSGRYGTSADTVIGLKIVTASGNVLTTGSGAVEGGSAFLRHYGPDLTGLFTGDCGALGIKAEITLRLISSPKHKSQASFSFGNYQDMISAMSEISRSGLASECFGFDPVLQRQRLKRESLAKDVKSLASVMKSSSSVLGALKKGAKIATAGRGFMKNVPYSLHVTTENRHNGAAKYDIEQINTIALETGGTVIENTIPILIAANPFMPPNSMIGPAGERWAPVHAVIPHSKAVALMDGIENLFAKYDKEITQYDIKVGTLFTSVGASAIVLEPVFFWPDELKAFHRRNIEPSHLKKIRGFSENLKIRRFVAKLRSELTALCLEHSAIHFQIGKAYRYKEGINHDNFNLLGDIKKHVDPNGRLNPGALGLYPD